MWTKIAICSCYLFYHCVPLYAFKNKWQHGNLIRVTINHERNLRLSPFFPARDDEFICPSFKMTCSDFLAYTFIFCSGDNSQLVLSNGEINNTEWTKLSPDHEGWGGRLCNRNFSLIKQKNHPLSQIFQICPPYQHWQVFNHHHPQENFNLSIAILPKLVS